MTSVDYGPVAETNHAQEGWGRASTSCGRIAEWLARLQECLSESGPDLRRESERLAGLRERLSTGRFHLAVLGQFKRGKSTLLNALLGEALLPTSIVPVNADFRVRGWSLILGGYLNSKRRRFPRSQGMRGAS